MNIPYTYLIRCIPENKVYYGVKYSKDANPSSTELSKTRNSSRQKIKVKDGTHPFQTLEHSMTCSVRATKRNTEMNKIRNAQFSKTSVECPHRHKVGRQPGMSIHHMNNCKERN